MPSTSTTTKPPKKRPSSRPKSRKLLEFRLHPENEVRAMRVLGPLDDFMEECGPGLVGDYETGAQDMITNLCHLLRMKGINPDGVVELAVAMFHEEEEYPDY